MHLPVLKSPNGDSDGNTQFDTAVPQVGRDEVKARMKELESELARAEQTSALREEVANSLVLDPSCQFALQFSKSISIIYTQREGSQLSCSILVVISFFSFLSQQNSVLREEVTNWPFCMFNLDLLYHDKRLQL